jgi:hypothetical protein
MVVQKKSFSVLLSYMLDFVPRMQPYVIKPIIIDVNSQALLYMATGPRFDIDTKIPTCNHT